MTGAMMLGAWLLVLWGWVIVWRAVRETWRVGFRFSPDRGFPGKPDQR